MEIFIRADISNNIGTGHMSRCCSLVKYIKSKFPFSVINLIHFDRIDVSNYIYPHQFNDTKFLYIKESEIGSKKDLELTKNYINKTEKKSKIKSYLIIDNYKIGNHYEYELSKSVDYIVVIDDYDSKMHYCHFYINYSYNTIKNTLLPAFCKKLMGINYFIIDPSKKRTKIIKNQVKIINISFGGTDPTNETVKILKLLLKDIHLYPELYNIKFDILVGKYNQNHILLIDMLNEYYLNNEDKPKNIELHYNKNLLDYLEYTDLCIGASGVSGYERIFYLCPSLIIPVVENQLRNNRLFIDSGVAKNYKYEDLLNQIQYYINNPSKVSEMSKLCRLLNDGLGCNRIYNEIFIIL